ncbi:MULTISPECIES: hypothetical protein [Pantoea]|mgnify:CR=1 FL=1|uniref:hypothetical protein n=1 Tax=Pantoea TaxID=53335 RepID=UPI000232346E|nr:MULTISPECIES: hypothetical protein [Pantoea]AER31339.1 hypothetical protein PAGR_g0806 [Pantoea ananatis PA13]MDI3364901.1 hypothetical protein [Pantoea sp. V108_6]PQK99041.1 hypothetical protein CG435_16005 [Pantoea ananatis]RQN06354.1 hypothetical protein EHQ51_16485 [Pantoea ananatis]CRH35521.1 Uncharacterized protein BN1183_CH_00470 [Pantoea ananatis]
MTISKEKTKTNQYQIRLSHEFRTQLEEQACEDGDVNLATWIKRVLRKELKVRGIEPKGNLGWSYFALTALLLLSQQPANVSAARDKCLCGCQF